MRKCPFITYLVTTKVEKENHIRKVAKSEKRKVKNIISTNTKYQKCYKIEQRFCVIDPHRHKITDKHL